MWFPGFLSFLKPRSLICKVEIETSLLHRTVQRVTFLNNHNRQRLEGKHSRPWLPWGWFQLAMTLCYIPFAVFLAPTCPSSFGRTRPVAPSVQKRVWVLQLWLSGPIPSKGFTLRAHIYFSGPPQQPSTWSLTRPSPRKAVLRFIHKKELLLFREQSFWTHDAWAQHQRPAPEVTRKSPQASSRLACCWGLADRDCT